MKHSQKKFCFWNKALISLKLNVPKKVFTFRGRMQTAAARIETPATIFSYRSVVSRQKKKKRRMLQLLIIEVCWNQAWVHLACTMITIRVGRVVTSPFEIIDRMIVCYFIFIITSWPCRAEFFKNLLVLLFRTEGLKGIRAFTPAWLL